MRLVCPNCDAQYEVADAAIPDSGRDVQCSNCGHTWFQQSLHVLAEAEAEAKLFGDDIPMPEESMTGDTMAAPAPAASSVASPPAPVDEDEEIDPPAAPVAAAQRKGLDESLLAVLREEADRETQARRDEGSAIEVQQEMALPAAAPLSPTARRLAMLKGQNPDAPPPPPARTAARRDLLPDVEEINSTLRSAGATRQDDDDDASVDALPDLTKQRSGFRSGFLLMILLAVVATVAYVAAPHLSAQFPAAAPAITTFVQIVDQMRGTLDTLMQAATRALQGGGS